MRDQPILIDEMRYDCAPTSDEIMDWPDGSPCSQCGQPLKGMVHSFEGGGMIWQYKAPLYHNVEHRVGFCGPPCVMEWMKFDYQRITANPDE